MDTLIDRIDAIKGIFEFLDIEWVEPYETTQGAIKRQEVNTKIQGMYSVSYTHLTLPTIVSV